VIRNGKTNITHKKLGFNLTFYFQIQFIEKLYNEHEVTMFKIRIRISHTNLGLEDPDKLVIDWDVTFIGNIAIERWDWEKVWSNTTIETLRNPNTLIEERLRFAWVLQRLRFAWNLRRLKLIEGGGRWDLRTMKRDSRFTIYDCENWTLREGGGRCGLRFAICNLICVFDWNWEGREIEFDRWLVMIK
jgi:hypothetical protein